MKIEEIFVSKDVLSNCDFEDAFELVHRHSEQVDRFDQLLDHLRLEHHDAVDIAQHLENDFKDNVFHAGEVESLDRELHAVLNRHLQVDLLFAVALHAQHQVQIKEVRCTSVDFEVVDQIIQHISVEGFDVLDDQQNRSVHSFNSLLLEDSFHAVEGLVLDDLGVLVLSLVKS